MQVECTKCLNVNMYDTLLNMPIRITSKGLCNQCSQWEPKKNEFNRLLWEAKKEIQKIFERIKKDRHQYDALLWLSGGKDSSAALILAKEKYNLNILAITTDKGNFYDGVKENINCLTDRLGIDHVFLKAPKPLLNRIFRFGLTTLSTGGGGIACTACSSFVHLPLASRFLLEYDIPLVITGIDRVDIQNGYFYESRKNINFANPFLNIFPTILNHSHLYEPTIKYLLDNLERFATIEEFPKLKTELLQIISELISRYALKEKEIEAYKQLGSQNISLTAIEISTKKELLHLLKNYGWVPPVDMYTGEIIGTDCKIGGILNAIFSSYQKRRTWSYRIRAGMVTKEEALAEIVKESPNISRICSTLKEIGLNKFENRLKCGWQNHIFRDYWNYELIQEINAHIN